MIKVTSSVGASERSLARKWRKEEQRATEWDERTLREERITSKSGGDVGLDDGDLAMGVTEKIKGKSVRERDSVSFCMRCQIFKR